MTYLRLLAVALRLSWRHFRWATVGLVAVKAATAVATPATAVALRASIDGIVRGDRTAAVLGAGAAAVAFALQMYLHDLGRVLEVMLVDHLGALYLRPRIEGELAALPGLDHLERTDLLDRITVLRGAGGRLSASMLTAIAVVFDVVTLVLLLILLGASVTPWLLPLVVFAAAPVWFDHRGRRVVSQAELDTAEPFRLQRHLFNLAAGPAGGKELRVAGAGEQLAARQRQAWAEAMRGQFRAHLRAMGCRLAGWTLFTTGFGAGLGLVVYRAAHGIGTVGDLVLAITVAVTLRDSVQHALFYVNMAMSGHTIAEPYRWLLDHAAEQRPANRPVPARLRDGITLDRVTFTYPGTDRPALDGVSCHLPAGSVVAIVGEYGSGKTTLVKLLAKFYPPDDGRILVDGVALAELDTTGWRARSSAAFQDFGRFHTRFGDAIGIGDLPHLHDDDRVAAAVRAADAEQLVGRLPQGLDTQLGRRFNGVELSEGQWQKTALARAAMRTAPLLFVLDEPTASLDAPSEHAIFSRYMALARRSGAVTVIVSHRFSTVTGADLILVLDGGRLVEQGTHEALLAAGGRYADLYSIQANAYERPAEPARLVARGEPPGAPDV